VIGFLSEGRIMMKADDIVIRTVGQFCGLTALHNNSSFVMLASASLKVANGLELGRAVAVALA
jgi:hypothetical protein